MQEPLVQFKNFTWKYTAQAEPTLYDINLTIHKGEKVLICGPSGCGKSTIAHCLNGLIPASYNGEAKGDLLIGGKPFRDLDIFQLSKITGTVLQDSDGQFIGLTVGEDIAFALENDNVNQKEMKERVLKAAQRVGIENFLSHAPHELSGGQKQRVSLAGIMVDEVELYLFDEPLANLDPGAGKKTIELIEEIHKSSDAAVVIIEHRLEDVLHRSVDRVILMDEGRILCDTTPDELLASNLLIENGIREPLYATALKYAGVTLTPEMKPGRMETLLLSDADKAKVQAWFHAVPKPEAKPERKVFLEAKNISFAYDNGLQALRNINFYVKEGEMLAIVGRNGAGKSTFSKVICGFVQPQEGEILLGGRSLKNDSIKERADHIAYVMQNPNQMITKPMIREEVAMGLMMENQLTKEEIDQRVDQTLKICGLYPFRSWPISALSFGQKKRVTIASILSMKPEIIILDEPTAGQDLRHYTEFMEFLKKLNEEGVTIILITHDMHLMLEYCERAVIFNQSQIIADKPCEEILTDDEITKKASLKKTSLSDLAALCDLPETEFVKRFIQVDRGSRR